MFVVVLDLRDRSAHWSTRLDNVMEYIETRLGRSLYKEYGRKKQLRIVIDQCNRFALTRPSHSQPNTQSYGGIHIYDGELMTTMMDWARHLIQKPRNGVRLIFVTSDGKALPYIRGLTIVCFYNYYCDCWK